MKTFLLIRKISLKTLFLFVIVVTAKSIRAQSIPELAFTNPALKSGVAGQDGAVYLYNNVCPGVDAEVSIISRSGSQVVLSNIDTTAPGVGYDKAFQPVAGIPGTVPANTNWWIKFNITFYESGTSKKTKLTRFNIEGFGIDGDGNTLAEWIQVNRAAAIEMDPSTILNYSVVTNYGSEADYKVTGSTASMPVINVSETKNKAIFTYRNKDNFDFVIGAQSGSATSSEGMRTVSFLVKQFSLFSLPVKLISFSASLTNSKTELNWKTTAELNLSHYAVEKSTDGINFSAIGTVMANGSQTTETSYHFSDMVNSQETIIYYRLRSVDFDGKGEYSEIRVIRTNKKEQGAISILAYPNPVSTEVRVTIPESWQQKKLLYEIITLAGQTVMQKENTNSSQTETVNVNNLSAGIYLLRVTCKGQTAQQRIVKD